MKRRHYFIKKRYQAKFIACFLLVALLGALMAQYLFDYLAQHKIEQILYSMRLPSGHPGELLFKEMILATLLALGVVVAGVMLVAYLQTQKARGPMDRIAQEAENMAKGDLATPVRLRHGDEFKEILPAMNGFKAYLRQRFVNAHEIAGRIEELLKTGELCSTKGELPGLLEDIRAELHAMKGDSQG